MSDNPTQILVIDDEPNSRTSLCEKLEARGFGVIPLGDGQAAIQYCAVNQVGAIIIELDLDGTSGLEVIKTLKSQPAAPDGIFPHLRAVGPEEADRHLDIRHPALLFERLRRA